MCKIMYKVRHSSIVYCAFCVCTKLFLPISNSSLVLTWLYVVGYFLRASSVSKFAGSLLRISAATSSSVSSLDLPPPLDVRAYR